jgi:hypothetical protein
MDARYKLLDLAAFLDRLEKATGPEDHRVLGLRAALPILLKADGDRVAQILHLWSDPSVAPIEKADTKAASGVWPGLK